MLSPPVEPRHSAINVRAGHGGLHRRCCPIDGHLTQVAPITRKEVSVPAPRSPQSHHGAVQMARRADSSNSARPGWLRIVAKLTAAGRTRGVVVVLHGGLRGHECVGVAR